MRYVLILLALLVLACEVNSKPPSAQVDALTPAAAACENLRKIGCGEGYGAPGGEPCAIILERASELRPLPIECWMTARDRAAARSCGALACTPVLSAP